MNKLTSFNTFIKLIFMWLVPWAVTAIVLGLEEHWMIVLFLSFCALILYAFLSKWICLWSLGNTKELQSPISQRVVGKIELLEVQSPERFIFLFKGFPWEMGVIAISTGELARAKEVDLQKMITRSEIKLQSLDVYIWTWVYPVYRFFSKSQELLSGSISAGKLILGILWYAPYRLSKVLIRKHTFEFTSVDAVIEVKDE